MNKSNYTYIPSRNHGVKAWINTVPIEDQVIEQLKNTAQLPFIYKWVAAMPDVHFGKGSTVGSVIPTKRAIIPAAVGVDIGCGMEAVKTGLTANDLPDNLEAVRAAIEKHVPVGRGDWGDKVPRKAEDAWADPASSSLEKRYRVIEEKHPKIADQKRRTPARQIGTMGGGNHFLEVCLDEDDCVWVMLHSGSRGVGNRIGSYFIEQARTEMERWFVHLPDKDLAYLPEGAQLFDDYIEAVLWAQDYARANRQIMMMSALDAMKSVLGPFNTTEMAVSCHHNYVEKENHFGENVWVTRKGAVRARKGDLGIIPGSMGAKSYIVRGLGNPESFHSCAHGAGRKMSRRKARETFTVEDHIAATEGVACRKDTGVLDETPGAYKDIDAVMAAQTDLVEPLYILRQIVCVKG